MQNSVIRLESNILPPQIFAPTNFWAGYATAPSLLYFRQPSLLYFRLTSICS